MADSETGHAKNVGNFQSLISFCAGYGVKYNPNKSEIRIPSLNNIHANAINKISVVNDAYTPWSNAVSARRIIFKPLSKLITRVMNALEASDVPEPSVESAKTIARKIQGKRAVPKNNSVPNNTEATAESNLSNISASQMGYDNRIDNTDKLIKFLASQPGYAPNETELTVASLTAMLASFSAANTQVLNAFSRLSNARIDRNRILYQSETGLVDIAGKVKKYIKSVFGATSPQFKQVSKLQFFVIKRQ